MFGRFRIPEIRALAIATPNRIERAEESRAPIPLDTPRQPTRRVQDGDDITEPQRQETTGVTTHSQLPTTTKAPDDQPERPREGRKTNRSVRFADDLPHYNHRPGGDEEKATVRGRSCERPRRANWRRRTSATRGTVTRGTVARGRSIHKCKKHEEDDKVDAESSYEDVFDDDDSNEDVAFEENPLEKCPPFDESSFSKLAIDTKNPADPGLLKRQLADYAAAIEKDPILSVKTQQIIRNQGRRSRLQMKELRRLTKQGMETRIPVCLKEGVPEWDFDWSESGGAASSIISNPWTSVWLPPEAEAEAEEEPRP